MSSGKKCWHRFQGRRSHMTQINSRKDFSFSYSGKNHSIHSLGEKCYFLVIFPQFEKDKLLFSIVLYEVTQALCIFWKIISRRLESRFKKISSLTSIQSACCRVHSTGKLWRPRRTREHVWAVSQSVDIFLAWVNELAFSSTGWKWLVDINFMRKWLHKYM